MTRARLGRPLAYAVHHFPDGLLALAGETTPRKRVALSILSRGNPSGALTVSGTPGELFALAAKIARVCERVRKGR